ncbi:DMT family transporter [Clostridium oceanicum]|uniref:DMT family transporter n=1 Tax=Clostridium oceanicum TaxID=1543 RepID=A0ABP3USR3_9CLOT
MNSSIVNKNKGLLLALIASISWGYIGIPSRTLQSINLNSCAIAFFRTSIATILFLILIIRKNINYLKINCKGLLECFAYGIIAICGSFVTYNLAIEHISIALATMLMFMSPLWVLIISYFLFKEKFTSKKISSMILTLSGCFIVCGLYNPTILSINLVGMVYAIICSFSFASQTILGKIAVKKYNQNTFLFYSFLSSSIALLPFIDITSTINTIVYTNNFSFIIKDILILGVINTFIASSAYTKSINFITANTASVIATLQLVIASILAYFILGESLSLIQIIGMGLIILSILLLEFKKETFIYILSKVNLNRKTLHYIKKS